MAVQTEYPCRVCGSTWGDRIQSVGGAYIRCQTCSTIQRPMTLGEYRALDPAYDAGSGLIGISSEDVERWLSIEEKKVELRPIVDGLAPAEEPRSFLDIGCGLGGYMLAAKELGFEVLGFEPDRGTAKIATELLGLSVIDSHFCQDAVGERRFDLIMLSHVIEHIYEPRTFLAEAASLLRPGGVLVVLTPNAGSLAARVTGNRWPMLQPVDHVTLLAKDSVRHLVPPGMGVTLSSSEYPHEFATTIASVFKNVLQRSNREVTGKIFAYGKKVAIGAGQKMLMLRYVLTALSFPFYRLSMARNNASCLRLLIYRPS